METMWDIKNTCQTCRECCKFSKDGLYFAPVLADSEVAELVARGVSPEVFQPYRNERTLFQIKLVPWSVEPLQYACPLLDETTHLCTVYDVRPIDCRLWPLLFMKETEGTFSLSALRRDCCAITREASDEAFRAYIDRLAEWFHESGFIETLRKHKGLAWDKEPEADFIQHLDV